MNLDLWRTELDGVLATEAGEFRLVVQQVNGAACFLVFQHPKRAWQSHPAVLASGTEESVHAAMSAAGRMARRLSALGQQGQVLWASTAAGTR